MNATEVGVGLTVGDSNEGMKNMRSFFWRFHGVDLEDPYGHSWTGNRGHAFPEQNSYTLTLWGMIG